MTGSFGQHQLPHPAEVVRGRFESADQLAWAAGDRIVGIGGDPPEHAVGCLADGDRLDPGEVRRKASGFELWVHPPVKPYTPTAS